MAVTISLGSPYVGGIYSIFLLWMESNALEKSKNKSVTSRLFVRTPSMIRWISRMCDVVDLFFSKAILILSKNFFSNNFLNFWFDAVELLSILKLCSYGIKAYNPVVLGNFEFTVLEERENVAFWPSLYCILVIYCVALSEQ